MARTAVKECCKTMSEFSGEGLCLSKCLHDLKHSDLGILCFPPYSITGGCVCIHTAAFWWRNRSGRRDIMFHHCQSDRHVFFSSWKNKKGAKSFWTVGLLPLKKKTSGQSCQAPLAHYSFFTNKRFCHGQYATFGSACQKPCISLWQAWVGKRLLAIDQKLAIPTIGR